jgi:hypothetical protein
MSTSTETTTRIRPPLTTCYIGRPVSLYIDALDRRRRTHPQPSPAGIADPNAS